MRAQLAALARRREALVARAARERAALAADAAGARQALAEPLVIALAATVALAGASPRLRAWFVRAWVIGALARRLLR